MSNRARLYAGQTPALDNPAVLDPRDEALFIAGAAYTIPVFWLFCFAPDDFVTVTTPGGTYDTFVTELAAARRRLAERDGLARDRFPGHVAAWERWRQVIAAVPRRYLKLDPEEIWAMDRDPDTLTAQLSDAVDWFVVGNESEFEELLRLAGVRAYGPATRTLQAAPGVPPEACLLGWLERDAHGAVSGDGPGHGPA